MTQPFDKTDTNPFESDPLDTLFDSLGKTKKITVDTVSDQLNQDDGRTRFTRLRDNRITELSKLTDDDLLDKIVAASVDKYLINTVVLNYGFPAYTIAKNLKQAPYRMTYNQRRALINVFAHYETVKYDKNEYNSTDA